MLEVLNTLVEMGCSGSISPEVMRAACEGAFPAVNDILDVLWTECSPTCQDLLRHVRDKGEVGRAGLANADVEMLIERGFVHQKDGKVRRASRMLGRLLDGQPNEGSALSRLFGDAETYRKHLKGVLERRIAQIDNIDPILMRYLQRAIDDLPEHPSVFLTNVRGIVDQAFELIWNAEMQSRSIPSAWMSIWKRNDEPRINEFETTFPQGVQRLRLLNMMTGTNKSKACARYVTKSTYVLINGVHLFGDFGQHQEGSPVDSEVAYSALHLCIEMTASLARQLPRH
jgi:hypothetical protein